jgi:hypothetical protein
VQRRDLSLVVLFLRGNPCIADFHCEIVLTFVLILQHVCATGKSGHAGGVAKPIVCALTAPSWPQWLAGAVMGTKMLQSALEKVFCTP